MGEAVNCLALMVFLSLLEELVRVRVLRIFLVVIVLIFYIRMKREDNERNRRYFFMVFTLWAISKLVYYAMFGLSSID